MIFNRNRGTSGRDYKAEYQRRKAMKAMKAAIRVAEAFIKELKS